MVREYKAELWIKLSLPGVGQIGPGKIRLLQLIDEHESIAAAARAMGMAYRRAWLLVDEINSLFERPVVSKWQGGKSKGGASLSEFGKSVVDDYAQLVRTANASNRDLLDKMARRAAQPAESTSR
jgi:molybdate transport system regulatory protein